MRPLEHLVNHRRFQRIGGNKVEAPCQIAHDRPGLGDAGAVLGDEHGKLAEGGAALRLGPWLAEIFPSHRVSVGLVAVAEHQLRGFAKSSHLEIDKCEVGHDCLL